MILTFPHQSATRSLNWQRRSGAKIHGDSKTFNYLIESGFEYDVQKRVPATDKAKKFLVFSTDTELSTMLDEVIPWIRSASTVGLV